MELDYEAVGCEETVETSDAGFFTVGNTSKRRFQGKVKEEVKFSPQKKSAMNILMGGKIEGLNRKRVDKKAKKSTLAAFLSGVVGPDEGVKSIKTEEVDDYDEVVTLPEEVTVVDGTEQEHQQIIYESKPERTLNFDGSITSITDVAYDEGNPPSGVEYKIIWEDGKNVNQYEGMYLPEGFVAPIAVTLDNQSNLYEVQMVQGDDKVECPEFIFGDLCPKEVVQDNVSTWADYIQEVEEINNDVIVQEIVDDCVVRKPPKITRNIKISQPKKTATLISKILSDINLNGRCLILRKEAAPVRKKRVADLKTNKIQIEPQLTNRRTIILTSPGTSKVMRKMREEAPVQEDDEDNDSLKAVRRRIQQWSAENLNEKSCPPIQSHHITSSAAESSRSSPPPDVYVIEGEDSQTFYTSVTTKVDKSTPSRQSRRKKKPRASDDFIFYEETVATDSDNETGGSFVEKKRRQHFEVIAPHDSSSSRFQVETTSEDSDYEVAADVDDEEIEEDHRSARRKHLDKPHRKSYTIIEQDEEEETEESEDDEEIEDHRNVRRKPSDKSRKKSYNIIHQDEQEVTEILDSNDEFTFTTVRSPPKRKITRRVRRSQCRRRY